MSKNFKVMLVLLMGITGRLWGLSLGDAKPLAADRRGRLRGKPAAAVSPSSTRGKRLPLSVGAAVRRQEVSDGSESPSTRGKRLPLSVGAAVRRQEVRDRGGWVDRVKSFLRQAVSPRF